MPGDPTKTLVINRCMLGLKPNSFIYALSINDLENDTVGFELKPALVNY